MKKIFYLLLISSLLFSCKSRNSLVEFNLPKPDLTDSIYAKIVKIDSINNYFLIYAREKEKGYKIISKKNTNIYCKSILLDSFYSLKIRPLLSERSPQGTNRASNYLDIRRCAKFENNTEICTEPGIINIYETISLSGLCIRRILKH